MTLYGKMGILLIALCLCSFASAKGLKSLGHDFECKTGKDEILEAADGREVEVSLLLCWDQKTDVKLSVFVRKDQHVTPEQIQLSLGILQMKSTEKCYPDVVRLSKGHYCLPIRENGVNLKIGKCFLDLESALTFEPCLRKCEDGIMTNYDEWARCEEPKPAMTNQTIQAPEDPKVPEEPQGDQSYGLIVAHDQTENEVGSLTPETVEVEVKTLEAQGAEMASVIQKVGSEAIFLKMTMEDIAAQVQKIKMDLLNAKLLMKQKPVEQNQGQLTDSKLASILSEVQQLKQEIKGKINGIESLKGIRFCEGDDLYMRPCSCGEVERSEYGVMGTMGHTAVALVNCTKQGRVMHSLDYRDINHIVDDDHWYTIEAGISKEELTSLKERFDKWVLKGMPASYPCEVICTIKPVNIVSENFVMYKVGAQVHKLYYDKECHCVPNVQECSIISRMSGSDMTVSLKSENARYMFTLRSGSHVVKKFEGFVKGTQNVETELPGPGKYELQGYCNGEKIGSNFQISNKEYCNSKWQGEFMMPMRIYCKNSHIVISLFAELIGVIVSLIAKRFCICVLSGFLAPVLAMMYMMVRRCLICKGCKAFKMPCKKHHHSIFCSKCGSTVTNSDVVEIFGSEGEDVVKDHIKHRKYGCRGSKTGVFTEALIISFKTLQGLLRVGYNPILLLLFFGALFENLPYVDASNLNEYIEAFNKGNNCNHEVIRKCEPNKQGMLMNEVLAWSILAYMAARIGFLILSCFSCCMCKKLFSSCTDIGLTSIRLCRRCKVIFLDEGVCLFLMDETFRRELRAAPVHIPDSEYFEDELDEEGYQVPKKLATEEKWRSKDSVKWGTMLLRQGNKVSAISMVLKNMMLILLLSSMFVRVVIASDSKEAGSKEIFRRSILKSGFQPSNMVHSRRSERMDLSSTSVTTECNAGHCTLGGSVDLILAGVEGESIGYRYKPEGTNEEFDVDIKIMSAYREVTYTQLYETFPVTHHGVTGFSCTGTSDDCLKGLDLKVGRINFNVTLPHDSSWMCNGWCPLVGTGATCGSCWCERTQNSPTMKVLKEVSSTDKIIICISVGGSGYCKEVDTTTNSGPVTVQKTGSSGNIRHELMALDPKTNRLYKGPINDVGEASDKFGAVQSYSNKVFYKDDSRYDRICHFLREPRISYNKCCKDTWHMLDNLQWVESTRLGSDYKFRVFEGREFGFWRFRMFMPNVRFTQLVTSLNPSSVSGLSCTGCYDCMEGADCNIEIASPTSGFMHLKSNICSLASNKVLVKTGRGQYKFKLYCGTMSEGLEMEIGSSSTLKASTTIHLMRGGKSPESANFDVLTTEQLTREGCTTAFCAFDMFDGFSWMIYIRIGIAILMTPILVFLFISLLNCLCLLRSSKSHYM